MSFENAFNNIDRVMRNDEGLASELDYAEQTSWLLFLRYFDELAPTKLADFLRIRYGGTNGAKRLLGPIPEIRSAFVDVQGYLFR